MTATAYLNGAEGARELLVCFSHLRWNFVFQRPQHLLSRATRRFKVAFFEEPLREACSRPFLRTYVSREGVNVATPILPLDLDADEALAAQRSLLDRYIQRQRSRSLTTWYYTPAALPFSAHLTPDACVYDCMDELTAFKGASQELRFCEQRLFKQADLVFTGGFSLYEAKKSYHKSVHAFPSSIDAHHFGRVRQGAPAPEDMQGINGPKLGFFGVIDERMDLDFVAAMADATPHWNYVMLGPVVKIDSASLPRRHNIHWIGGRSYDDLPEYIASWNVGLMPFALNESTRFISPTKTPEFLAAGCPVVSTPIRDVIRPYGDAKIVDIAKDPQSAVACAQRLMDMPKEPWLAAVDKMLNGNSWDETWARMLDLMDGLREEASRPAAALSRELGGARV
ncbi:MAG: glycosyl transferase [Hyphomicrobiales bacterium]|nr:glycosyl transferase [Hyphomicrobiales bacterium]